MGQGIKGKPSSSMTTLAPPGVFRVPVPPEPRALQPQTCVLPPGGRGSTAPPASRPPLPGTFLGTSGGAGPPGWVELPQGGGKTGHPAHLSRPKLSSPDPPLFLLLLLCLLFAPHTLRALHSQPEPRASALELGAGDPAGHKAELAPSLLPG